MTRPLILDLFCGAGGAAMGYHRAGFDVVGVDIDPQPNYPFEFVQADALYPPFDLDVFDAIHASPPCQAYSHASAPWNSRLGEAIDRNADLLPDTRRLLEASGRPWVIENVPGAPMNSYAVVCGIALGLNVKRHRWFEGSTLLMGTPCQGHTQDFVIVFGGGVRGRSHQIGRTKTNGPIIRRPTLPLEVGQEAMGIDWMTRQELSEAIPPAYTEWIGGQLLAHLEAVA